MKSKSKSRNRFSGFLSTAFSKKYRLITFVVMFAVIGGGIFLARSFAATSPIAYLRNSNSTGVANIKFAFGDGGDIPLACNWDGNGPDGFGIRRPGNSKFYLSDTLSPTKVKHEFVYGNSADKPICGDWNGDGKDTIGVFQTESSPGSSNAKPGKFQLRNSNTTGLSEKTIKFGQTGDVPLACDFNGDGKTDIGVYRPSNAHFYLSYKKLGVVDKDIHFGNGGDQPVCGDWNGDKRAGIGVHRPSNSRFYLSDQISPTKVVYEFMYGNGGGQQVFAGDWNGDGKDSVGIYRMDSWGGSPSAPTPTGPSQPATPPGNWKPPAAPKTTYTCVGDTVIEVKDKATCDAILEYARLGRTQPPPPPPAPRVPPPAVVPAIATGACHIMGGKNGFDVLRAAQNITADACSTHGVAAQYAGMNPISVQWGSTNNFVTVWVKPGGNTGECGPIGKKVNWLGNLEDSYHKTTLAGCSTAARFVGATNVTWKYPVNGTWQVWPIVYGGF